MTQISRPWDGTGSGDGGPYSADQWSEIYRQFIGIGAGAGGAGNSGILWGSGNNPDPGLTVQPNSPTGQSVILTPGAALVHGTPYFNDANLVLAVAANGSGNSRVDTVVLRKDWTAKTVRAVVKQGTPAASPVPPGMTQSAGTTWEIPLGDLTLANGYLTITNSLIANRLNYKNVAPIDVIDNVQNASGVTVNAGDVAVWGTISRQVTTSGNLGAAVAGVWMDRVVNGGYGRILRRGIYPVRMSAAVAALNSPVVHLANFVASVPATGASQYNAFAVTLETTSGAGLCLCYVDVVMPRPKANVVNTRQTPADITIVAPAAFADVDSTYFKVTFTTNTGKALVRFIVPAYLNFSVAGTGWLYFNLFLDATTLATADTNGLIGLTYDQAALGDRAIPVTIEHVFSGLTPGQHAVTLQWKVVNGTGTGPTAGIRQYNSSAGFTAKMLAMELDA